ncbi:50S ribosomal protein L10 [Aggregicoccus sp. 17bor-14]|uniref:50S ribosomal protein L10 n=1 Tax=Myxococcaceae TaxID=31 RepID=UPI0012F330DE|nr:50S ribosomal protein L10 [Simulacricoccus sp. 17bor-14]MRI86963.1 50S ribosomal protein L10 [Aggregicoccus sp. 17bor-14]
MLKSEKEELIKELNEKFAKTRTGIVAEFSKLNVETVTKLRKKLREGKVEYKVLKNSLAKRAAKGTPVEVISGDFTGPVAMVLSYDDVVAPAKILSEFIKDMETIKVRSAVVEGRKVNAEGVKALAKMPGLPELRAQILGMLTQPAGKLVRTIAAPGSQLARVIQAYADKK